VVVVVGRVLATRQSAAGDGPPPDPPAGDHGVDTRADGRLRNPRGRRRPSSDEEALQSRSPTLDEPFEVTVRLSLAIRQQAVVGPRSELVEPIVAERPYDDEVQPFALVPRCLLRGKVVQVVVDRWREVRRSGGGHRASSGMATAWTVESWNPVSMISRSAE